MNTCACGNLADGNGTTCQRCAALHELGLKAGATDAEVKTAYRLYVKAWHPDRFPGDEKSRSAAQEKLKTINSAYDFLTSPSSKGRPYRPKAATPSAQPQEPAQQKQNSAKQPPPAGGRSQEPPPKENAESQAPPRPPNPIASDTISGPSLGHLVQNVGWQIQTRAPLGHIGFGCFPDYHYIFCRNGFKFHAGDDFEASQHSR